MFAVPHRLLIQVWMMSASYCVALASYLAFPPSARPSTRRSISRKIIFATKLYLELARILHSQPWHVHRTCCLLWNCVSPLVAHQDSLCMLLFSIWQAALVCELFPCRRIPISQEFIEMVIGRLRSDDIYNQVSFR